MLPIKCVDAILPLWGFALAGDPAGGRHRRVGALAARGAGAVRCCAGRSTCALSGIMWTWHRRLFPGRGRELPGASSACTWRREGLVFNWFRQIAVLNAYSWFVRRVQKWHQPRWGRAGHAAAASEHSNRGRTAKSMSIIEAEGLTKVYRTYRKEQGLWGAIKGLATAAIR